MDHNDTLGRWMSHYIADLVQRVKSAEGIERERLQSECAGEILRLWKHRQSLRSSNRPLSSYDSIFRALARLDPHRSPWDFWGYFDEDRATNANGDGIDDFLKAALAIEVQARDVVRELILCAADAAANKESKWIELAERVKEEEPGLLRALRLLNRPSRRDLRRGVRDDEAAADTSDDVVDRLSATCRAARDLIERHQAPSDGSLKGRDRDLQGLDFDGLT